MLRRSRGRRRYLDDKGASIPSIGGDGDMTMKECPHCGSDEGYYEKITVSGKSIYRYNFDGSEAENGDMYDGLSYKRRSNFAYCLECEKRIFKL
jgi:hypothetical protein